MDQAKSYDMLVSDTSIHIREIGEGQPLVLLHGFPQNSHSWDRLIPFLSKYFRIIAIDLRGMGESANCSRGLNKRNLALDLKLILDHLKISKATLVAHDIAGLIAQRFALDYPNYIDKLICISAAPISNLSLKFILNPKQFLKSWYVLFFQIPLLPKLLLHFYPHLILNMAFKHAELEPGFAENIESMRMNCLPQLSLPKNNATLNLYRSLYKDYQVNQADIDKPIPIPTLWIQGENDPFIPKMQDLNMKRFSNLKMILFKDKGHWLPDLAPEPLSQQIINFVNPKM